MLLPPDHEARMVRARLSLDGLSLGDAFGERFFPLEQWQPGDVIVTNDPFSGGQHLPDFLTFKPVFHDGERIAIVGTLCHHIDVGGSAAGPAWV